MYFYTLSQPNQTQERKLLARLEAWCKSAGCQLPHYHAMQISQTGFLLGRLNKQNNRDPKHLLWDKYTVRQLKILVWFFERIKGYVLLRLVEKHDSTFCQRCLSCSKWWFYLSSLAHLAG